MAVIHISEADAVRDFAALLTRVREGEEVIIDGDAAPVAVVQPAPRKRRTLEESLAALEAREKERGYAAVMDDDFAADMREIIANRKPRKSAWD